MRDKILEEIARLLVGRTPYELVAARGTVLSSLYPRSPGVSDFWTRNGHWKFVLFVSTLLWVAMVLLFRAMDASVQSVFIGSSTAWSWAIGLLVVLTKQTLLGVDRKTAIVCGGLPFLAFCYACVALPCCHLDSGLDSGTLMFLGLSVFYAIALMTVASLVIVCRSTVYAVDGLRNHR